MWEIEMVEEDNWSLMAILNESARKAKRRGHGKGVLNTTTRPDTITDSNNYGSNPFHNPTLFSHDQFGAGNNNNIFGTLPLPVTTMTGNQHLFLGSYQNFSMKPPNPVTTHNPIAVELLQDFKEVSAPADDNLIFQNGLRQLPPAEQLYLKPKRGSPKTPITVYHYRRKKLERRSVHRLSKDELKSSEKWAWRKYGQKPIKGSPYPRNYYKCSSLKSCLARKHVERCPDEPSIYIVTHSGTHNHPMPTYRNHTGPRPKRNVWSANYLSAEAQSPTTTMVTNLSAGPSGSGSGSGENNVEPLDGNENGEDSGGEEGTNNANGYYYESILNKNLGAQRNGIDDIWNEEMIEQEFSF